MEETPEAPAPEPAAKANKFVMQNIDLNSLLAEEQANMETKEEVKSIALDEVEAAWQSYSDQLESDSLRVALKQVELTVEDTTVIVSTGSNRYADTIRQDLELVPFLRAKLRASNMLLRIEIDEDLRKKHQPKTKKILGPREIYSLMRDANPIISDLQKRFDLYPD